MLKNTFDKMVHEDEEEDSNIITSETTPNKQPKRLKGGLK